MYTVQKKALLTLTMLIQFISLIYGQSKVSKAVYFCQTDVTVNETFNGKNTLYFNNSKGLYIHNDCPTENSYGSSGQPGQVAFTKGDPEGMPVFMDLGKKELYYKTPYGHPKFSFILREDLPQIDWQIHPDTKLIGSFQCTKASGTFGGRVYDVWFTPEIPASLGPYKLWGLPGLILEAKSRDNMVRYSFQSFHPETEEEVALEKPQIGKEISWEGFELFIINRLLSVESLSTPDVKGTNHDPPADYTIEREKFTIISEYKKQRNAKNK
jgi:GLPGLI family protein